MYKFNDVYGKICKKCQGKIKERHKRENIIRIVIILIALYIEYSIIMFGEGEIEFISLLSLVVMIGVVTSFVIVHRICYKELYKKEVIRTLVEEMDESFAYGKGVVASRDYKNADFEQKFDNFYVEDCIQGTVGENNLLQMGEIKTEVISIDEEGRKENYTQFHGLFAVVKMEKFSFTQVRIRQNGVMKRKYKTDKITRRNISSSGVERLEMDSSEFEQIYDVFSDDKIKTMQILTADVMQLLVDFRIKYSMYPEITIKDNKVYLRFAIMKNLFEPAVFKKILDYEYLHNQYKFLENIVELIDKLIKNIGAVE